MATQPNAVSRLPLFYNNLVPLSSVEHPRHGIVARTNHEFTRGTHAVPLTVDEFALAHRYYPIVFGGGATPAPLALIGLTEGQNLFIDDKGEWRRDTYIPAYIRRYPFMLAKLSPDSQTLSLVFDDSCDLVREDVGEALFAGTEASDTTKSILSFCEQFEQSVERTRMFMDEINKLNLLIDAEVTVQHPAHEKPAVFRGFRMVSEEKLREIRGDQARKLVQNGMLGLIYAHMLSLSLIGEFYGRTQGALTPADAA